MDGGYDPPWQSSGAHNSQHRHRGRGRGKGRGRGRGGWRQAEPWGRSDDGPDTDRGQQSHTEDSDRPKRGRGGRHPPGLTGREIGMFYAKKSKDRREREERSQRQFVQMDSQKERHLSNLLASIRASDQNRSRESSAERPARKKCTGDRYYNWDEPSTSGTGTTARTSSNASKSSTSTSARKTESQESDEGAGFDPHKFEGQNQGVADDWETADYETAFKTKPAAATASPAAESKPGCSFHGDDLEMGSDSDNDLDFSKLAKEADQRTESERDTRRSKGDADSSNSDDEDEDKEDDEDADDREDADEGDDDEAVFNPSQVTELFHYDDDDTESAFITELREHNEANRRSQERLSGVVLSSILPQQNEELDQRLKEEHQQKQTNPQYQTMMKFREKLPSYNMRKKLLQLINKNQIVVISGETGCGKTTQVTQFILDDYIEKGKGSLCRIVCTQPRRISAISVAERVANERAEGCGEGSVGYQIRLEQKIPRKQGSILYCTTGIMLKWLASDMWLAETTHVVLDEIHERDLHSDFLMIIMKDLIENRPDLKLILMSATLNAEMFSQYFGNCPMINIPGYTFPVKEYLLEDVIEMMQYRHGNPPEPPRKPKVHGRAARYERQKEEERFNKWLGNLSKRYSKQTREVLQGMDFKQIDIDLAATLIDHIVQSGKEGAILVFMPGWEQIKTLHTVLTQQPKFNNASFRIIPLHSLMPTTNQKQVFERPPPGVRKIVIATNIAETSITIDDVVFVIDCGKIKMKNFDAEHNIATLQPEWVSKANARQRRGRAGRVQAGECYHLYTSHHWSQFSDYQLPEMLRTRLEELCLQIKLLKLGRIEPFVMKAMQTPSREALHLAVQTLTDLNALDQEEELTALGYHLAKMPVDPHTGKMLLFAAMFCCLDPVLTVAASLSFKDAFYIPLGSEKFADRKKRELSAGSKSDHIMLANAYEGWERAKSTGHAVGYCWEYFLSASTLRMLHDMRNQFVRLLQEMGFVSSTNPKDRNVNKNSENWNLVKAVICAGLYPNVAKIKLLGRGRNKPLNLFTKTDRTVRIHPKSVNVEEREFTSPWMIYHLKMKTTNIYLYDCTEVSYYPLLFFGGDIAVRKDHGEDSIVVDDWISFRASKRTAKLVKELRVELDKLLEYKITHPGVTSWNPQEKEGALMRAIADLLTTQSEKQIMK